jgi:hypothetical protein
MGYESYHMSHESVFIYKFFTAFAQIFPRSQPMRESNTSTYAKEAKVEMDTKKYVKKY